MYAYHEALFAQDGRPLPDPDAAQPAERRQRQGRRLHPRALGARAAAPHHRRQLPGRRRRGAADAPPHAAHRRRVARSARKPTCRAIPSSRTRAPFNVYGIPAISVPCGFTAAGLPVGLMIAGPRFAEGPRPRAGARLRAGHRVAHEAAAAHPRHAGAAAGAHERRMTRRRPANGASTLPSPWRSRPGWPPASRGRSSSRRCSPRPRRCAAPEPYFYVHGAVFRRRFPADRAAALITQRRVRWHGRRAGWGPGWRC